jgi:hypothetical protein
MYRFALSLISLVIVNNAVYAQPRQARMVGGGSPDRGKCTIEVVVDGTADVEIRGTQAMLRNLAGRPPEWRRFECTGPMPANPTDFRFAGVDGRGRQELLRDPRQGGSAVVRLEDKGGGAEGYTFDIFWGGGGGRSYENPSYGGQRPGWGGGGRRMSTQEAVRVCQDAVRDQAGQRYRGRVEFLDARIDDNPGRNDWVIGRVAVHYPRGGQEEMRFSCSVDFDSGRVRSANIEEGRGHSNRDNGALQDCQRAVSDRIRRDGYGRVEFTSMDGAGRNDSFNGTAQAFRGPNFDTFGFSCSVDPRTGEVRNVDVRRR